MRTKMAGGGDSVDYDALTASQDDVVEGRVFLGSGSDETQRGNLTDREIKTQATPGVSSGMSETPVYDADSVQLTNDTAGRRTIAVAPPRGRYPGGNKAYVRVGPEEIGVTSDVIAVGHIAAGVTGDYGSDGTATANDIKAGKVAYTKEGRVVGAVKDYGSINKTIKDGETYDIQRGIYAEGKITAKAVTLSVSGRTVKASNGKEASVNYAGSNGVVSLETAGATGKQTFDIPDGYATSIIVDKTKAYDAGYAAGRNDGYKQGYAVGYADGLMGGYSGKIITVYIEAGAWFGGEGWHTTRCGGNFVYSITSKKWILDSGSMYEPGDATPYIDWVSCPVDASGKIGDTITVQYGCNSNYGSQGPTTVTYKKISGRWQYYSGNQQAGEAPYAKLAGLSANF